MPAAGVREPTSTTQQVLPPFFQREGEEEVRVGALMTRVRLDCGTVRRHHQREVSRSIA